MSAPALHGRLQLTPAQLAGCCDTTLMRAQNWLPLINETLQTFAIDTPTRAAAFLAQVAHESGRLVYVREIWGPTPAQRRYEGRKDLGNTQPGDGYRYRGRGLIQTTGRANYAMTRDRMREHVAGSPDFEAQPEMLETPRWAALSAGLYWHVRGLNALADAEAFLQLTRRINGGTNGMDDRMALWGKAKRSLGVS